MKKRGERDGRHMEYTLAQEGHCCINACVCVCTRMKRKLLSRLQYSLQTHALTHTQAFSVFLSQLPLDLKIAIPLSYKRQQPF